MIKIILLITCLALGSQALLAQNTKDTLVCIIEAEDSQGNCDTIFVYHKNGATSGFDAEFETNLFGVEPTSPLDIRFIQRTDTNYYSDSGSIYDVTYGAYWLSGYYSESYGPGGSSQVFSYGWCRPYPRNVDLKINYVSKQYNTFAVYCHTVNYPIKMDVCVCGKHPLFSQMIATITSHDSTSGKLLYNGYDANIYVSFLIDTSCIILMDICDIAGLLDSENVDILYPNPASDIVMLENCDYGSNYEIINNMGIVAKTGILSNESAIIDVSELPTAIYYIRTKNKIYKLIKENK